MNKSERYYDLDALRSILMSLGIVLHSANVFSPSPWAIQNIDTSTAYQSLVDFIHLFRMPAFFIVSGFFVHFSYTKKGPSIFITQRIPRIIIPLLVTAISLNSIQYWLINSNTDFLSMSYIISGGWVSHLWFLNCLIYYFSFAYISVLLLPKFLELVSDKLSFIVNKSHGLYLLFLPIVSMIFIKLSFSLPDTGEDVYNLSIHEAIYYAGFFIFGTFIGACNQARDDLLSVKATLIFILLTGSTWVFSLFFNLKFIEILLDQSLIWLLCSSVFFLFHQLLNYKSAFFLYLSNASYSIYLFHHILVILIGSLLVTLELNPFIKFCILVLTTFLLTNIIHYFFISRFSLLSYLFNGKSLRKIHETNRKGVANASE